MRFSLFALAAIAGVAAAQDSSESDAALQTCIDGCTKSSLDAYPDAARKCLATDDKQQRAACICQETALLTAMQDCITKTCPHLSGDVDLVASCKTDSDDSTTKPGDNGTKPDDSATEPSDNAPTTPNETEIPAEDPSGAASHTGAGLLPVLAATGALGALFI